MNIAIASCGESFTAVRACERLQAEVDAEVIVHVASLGDLDPTVLELAFVNVIRSACLFINCKFLDKMLCKLLI